MIIPPEDIQTQMLYYCMMNNLSDTNPHLYTHPIDISMEYIILLSNVTNFEYSKLISWTFPVTPLHSIRSPLLTGLLIKTSSPPAKLLRLSLMASATAALTAASTVRKDDIGKPARFKTFSASKTRQTIFTQFMMNV